jgi:glycosyltransferase involved in cell wall biosynthesis
MGRESFLQFVAEHDVYLSAALSDSSPVSLIEAMALGLIPVAAKIPGVEEWTKDSGALTFDINDAKGLKDSMSAIINSNDKRIQMRKRNLERVMARGIFENNVAARIDLMKQLIVAL